MRQLISAQAQVQQLHPACAGLALACVHTRHAVENSCKLSGQHCLPHCAWGSSIQPKVPKGCCTALESQWHVALTDGRLLMSCTRLSSTCCCCVCCGCCRPCSSADTPRSLKCGSCSSSTRTQVQYQLHDQPLQPYSRPQQSYPGCSSLLHSCRSGQSAAKSTALRLYLQYG